METSMAGTDMMPQRAGKRLAREWRMAGVLESGGRFIGKRLQGGAKFPTGGRFLGTSRRALPAASGGQQIRSDAGADGPGCSGSPVRPPARMKEAGQAKGKTAKQIGGDA